MWDHTGPLAALHAINPVRLAYVRDGLCANFGRDARASRPLTGLRVVDVGCGAGLMCEPLARLGADVTGLDAAPEVIAVAQRHAIRAGVAVEYRSGTIEDLEDGWDAVLAMEVVEHVDDAPSFLAEAGRCVRSGGMFFGATINRTIRSLALAVGIAEYFLGWLPPGTHDWRRFCTPGEFARGLRHAGLVITDIAGATYDFATDEWRRSRNVGMNFMVQAVRPAIDRQASGRFMGNGISPNSIPSSRKTSASSGVASP